jgi:hypothetical protein
MEEEDAPFVEKVNDFHNVLYTVLRPLTISFTIN